MLSAATTVFDNPIGKSIILGAGAIAAWKGLTGAAQRIKKGKGEDDTPALYHIRITVDTVQGLTAGFAVGYGMYCAAKHGQLPDSSLQVAGATAAIAVGRNFKLGS